MRIHLSVAAALVMALSVCLAEAYNPTDNFTRATIPGLTDFKQELDRAKSTKTPLLIAYSASWCEYCDALEEELLEPVVRNNIYQGMATIRKLQVDSGSVIDEDGDTVSASRFASERDVSIYPTLVIYDGDGREIVERIVGITTFDYMGDYIDKAVEKANRKMRQ